MKGRVLCVSGQQCQVEAGDRDWSCQLRGRLKRGPRLANSPVVAGDWVDFEVDTAGDDGMVERVHPRTSRIARASVGAKPHEQLFAVNIDQCVIVVSAREPALRPGFIDRAVVVSLTGNAEPVICINKIDLDRGGRSREVADLYAGLGYAVVMTSAVTGEGVERLKQLLLQKTSAFMGQSGVGKSTLLNGIEPGLGIRTSALMSKHDRGRHTTTSTRLHRLGGGAYVADTPGIKELQPFGLERSQLADYFVEMAPLTAHCQYRDCLHVTEPRCAVRAACDAGDIDSSRYEGYCRFVEDL